MNNKSFYIVVAILLVVGGISIVSYLPGSNKAGDGVEIADFPKEIGEWKADDVPISDRVYELLETKNFIIRNYKNQNGDKINLYIIYSQDNRKVSHPPEICLQGDGATVTHKSSLQITESIKAINLIVEKNTMKELVFYWYKAGKLNTDSYLKQQLNTAINKMSGKKSSLALIRVITEIKNNDTDSALKMLKGFSKGIEPLLNRYAP